MSESVETTKGPKHREVPEKDRAAEHLDNERTFLAWVRTNIALISLGFVIWRLGPFLNAGGGTNARGLAGRTLVLGIGLVVFGALVTLLAAWRYSKVNREIERGLVKTDRALVWFVTVAIVSLSVIAVAYMLLTD